MSDPADPAGPPLVELPDRLDLVPSADLPASVWRMHRRSDGPIWFGKGAAYRFDDPHGALPGAFGVLYAGYTADGAFVEAALRQGIGRPRPIALAYLRLRQLTRLSLPAGLRLLRLYGPGLAANRANAAISAAGPGESAYGLAPNVAANDAYVLSQAYARAACEHPQRPDGIVYRCKHDNDELAIALFARAGEPPPAVAALEQTGPLDEELFLREHWRTRYRVSYG